ncbi:hypothetical protein BOX15_Mlig025095g1, partial [Macrostomum lignano]
LSVPDPLLPLPAWMAGLFALLIAVGFVLSLYLWELGSANARAGVDRDNPKVIIRRFLGVSAVSLSVLICYRYFLMKPTAASWSDVLQLIGLRWSGMLPAVGASLLLTAILFTGPILLAWETGDGFFDREPLLSLRCCRTLVLAPVTEELCFRALMLPVLCVHLSCTRAAFLSPLFFGLAHFHHLINRLQRGYPLVPSLIQATFQFSYTYIFGVYSAYLYLRTGQLAAACAAHSFCNLMGFPDFEALANLRGIKLAVHGGAFVLGLVGWLALLGRLTEPAMFASQCDCFW